MRYTDVSLRINKKLKLPSLKTERLQGIRKEPGDELRDEWTDIRIGLEHVQFGKGIKQSVTEQV